MNGRCFVDRRSHRYFCDVYSQDTSVAQPFSLKVLENIRCNFAPLLESGNQDKTRDYTLFSDKGKLTLEYPFVGSNKLLQEGQKIVLKSASLEVVGVYLSVNVMRQQRTMVIILGPFADE